MIINICHHSQSGPDAVISGSLAYSNEETDRVSVATAFYIIDSEDSFDVAGTTFEIVFTTLGDEDGTENRKT